jgi:hypothetical protein
VADGIEISDALFPIIVQTMHVEVSDADVDMMIAWYDRHFEKKMGRHAILVYSTPEHRTMNAGQRKRLSVWQKEIEARTREFCVCSAVVLHSAFQRGAFTALTWVYPPPIPQRSFSTLPDAFDWILDMLRRERISIPPHVLRHRESLENRAI